MRLIPRPTTLCPIAATFLALAVMPPEVVAQDPEPPTPAAATKAASMDNILAEGTTVERLATGMTFTEGPVWLPDREILVFSDIPTSRLMQWSKTDGLAVFRASEEANGNLLDLDGRLLSCQHRARNVVRTATDSSIEVLVDTFEGRRLNSPNDLAIRSDGSIWFTDPTYGLGGRPSEVGANNVYRLDPASGELAAVLRGHGMPNGIVFSPDERRLYISDTGKLGVVQVFDVSGGRDDHALGEPRLELAVRSDGMCVDTSGNLYTTTRRGIVVFDPAGKELGAVAIPEQPANCCFGGPRYRTLFITAGTSLYRIELRIAGNRPKAAGR